MTNVAIKRIVLTIRYVKRNHGMTGDQFADDA